ncbi:MAG: hypothetical protein C4K60_15820 [Ideonella sp. MAG2]|nr:MAG: hypothetical protein C4K60_15820 [Ideonella sp. MAG2]
MKKEPSVAKFKPSGLSYITPSGQPWSGPSGSAKVSNKPVQPKPPLDEGRVQQVLDMMLLLSQSTTTAEMAEVMRQHGSLVGWQGTANEATVRPALAALRERELVKPSLNGRQELNPAAQGYREALLRVYTSVEPEPLWAHLAQRLKAAHGYTWSARPEIAAVGHCVVRAHLWLGRTAEQAEAMLETRGLEGHRRIWEVHVIGEAWLPELMSQADPLWLQHLMLITLSQSDEPHYPLAITWLEAEIKAGRLKPQAATCLYLGVALSGDACGAQADTLLGADWAMLPGVSQAVQALRQMQAGDLVAARTMFAANSKALRANKLKWAEMLPHWLQQLEVLAWLTSEDHKDWEVARKLCVAASGRRQPDIDDGPFGAWVQVIDARLGKAP